MTVEEQLIMEASRLLPKDSSKAEIKDSVNRTLKQLELRVSEIIRLQSAAAEKKDE